MDMESVFYLIIMIIITATLFVVPFIPAWCEWKYKTDAEPFKVDFPDKTIVDFTIRIFREYIETHFNPILEKYSQLETADDDKLADGTEYHVTGMPGITALSPSVLQSQKTNKVYLFCQNAVLPNGINFNNKIYGCKGVDIGASSTINSIMTEGDLLLESEVSIQKLAYSNTSIIIKKNFKATGYLRAKNKILFLGNAEFKYLNAPNIEFGELSFKPGEHLVDTISANFSPQRLLIENIKIPENTKMVNNFIIKETLSIGNKCSIFGSIKCYKDVKIGNNTTIIGSVICEKNITIGDNCFIQGPLVSAGAIRIGKNCCIGIQGVKTSVIAKKIFISTGCFIAGCVLAKVEGHYSV
jgi:acetyltransferase-like isoleucine patch superfamily enzyme